MVELPWSKNQEVTAFLNLIVRFAMVRTDLGTVRVELVTTLASFCRSLVVALYSEADLHLRHCFCNCA